MAEQSVRGRFVWHDLTTPDQKGAAEFYGNALGWKTMPWEDDSSYLMFAAPTGPLGGAVESKGDTPHWLAYIGTTDLEATVREAERLGGSVLTPPTDLPNAGRFAVLADPQGGAFGVHWSAASAPQAGAPQLGEFSWHELATTDHRAAFAFYQALFGWEKVLEHDMGPMGIYVIFGRDGAQWGGMFDKGDQGAPGPAYWLAYVRVKDVDGAVERVKAARGACLNGPMEVPGGDWIAQLRDPYGAFFAVHASAGDVQTAQPGTVPQRETQQGGAAPAREKAQKASRAPRKAGTKKKASKAGTKKKRAAATKRSAARSGAAKGAAKKRPAKKRPAKKKAAAKRSAAKTARNRPRKKAKKAAGKKKSRQKVARKSARAKTRTAKKRGKAPRRKRGR